jgi:hypothetical protein
MVGPRRVGHRSLGQLDCVVGRVAFVRAIGVGLGRGEQRLIDVGERDVPDRRVAGFAQCQGPRGVGHYVRADACQLDAGHPGPAALTGGFQDALWALGAIALLAVPAIFALVRTERSDTAAKTTVREPQPALAAAN